MLDHSLVINLTVPGVLDNATSQLRQEYQNYQQLLEAQPASVRELLEAQATLITEALDHRVAHIRYCLPDAVRVPTYGPTINMASLPVRFHKQAVGGLINHLVHHDLQSALLEQLSSLGKSLDPSVSTAAQLLRHYLAIYMVHTYLPSGRNVQYRVEADDDIPNTPMPRQETHMKPEVVLAQVGRMQNEGEKAKNVAFGAGQGFFLPNWVVLDDQQRLLVEDTQKAEGIIVAMGRYLSMLNCAVLLAPYMVVDEEYQRKRYGILGQLVNQGRALAGYEVARICETIKQRAASHDLDRGFSLSLPYFNDQTLALELFNFEVVPFGRVMFVPSFLVLAVRAQGAKVIQEARFNRTTRVNLIRELYTIERTFLG